MFYRKIDEQYTRTADAEYGNTLGRPDTFPDCRAVPKGG